MDNLNNDLIAYILSLTDTKTIGNCLRINKQWKQVIKIYSWMFNLNFCRTTIDDKSLKHFKNTKNINLALCNKITDKGLEYLKGVHIIDLRFCNQVTDNGLEYLKGAIIRR